MNTDIFVNKSGDKDNKYNILIYSSNEAKNEICKYLKDPNIHNDVYLYLCWSTDRNGICYRDIDDINIHDIFSLYDKNYNPFLIKLIPV